MSDPAVPADAASLSPDRLPRREFAPPRRVPFRVKIKAGVHESVWEHGRETLDKELCGVLLGRLYRDDTGPFLLVEDWVRGEHARSDGAQVTFTHETWDYIHEQIRSRHPKEPPDIVGWYHTHPGFGIFLSEMDLFIHSNFFSAPYQVALVVDPRSGEEGSFGWVGGKVERLPSHWVGDREIGAGGGPSPAAGAAAAWPASSPPPAATPPARPGDADEIDMVGWAGRIRSGTVLALLWGLLLGWVAAQLTFAFQVRGLVVAAAEGEVQGLVRSGIIALAQQKELEAIAARARALAAVLPEPSKQEALAIAGDADRAAAVAAERNRAVDRALSSQRTVTTTGELAVKVDRQGIQMDRLQVLVKLIAVQPMWKNVQDALREGRITPEQAAPTVAAIRLFAEEAIRVDPAVEPQVREALPGALPERKDRVEGGGDAPGGGTVSEAGGEPPLRITKGDLYTPGVEEWLQRESAIHAVPEEVAAEPPGPFAFLLNSVVYTTLAGLLGGFLGWCLLEPFFDDHMDSSGSMVAGFLFFPVIGMMIGGTVAAMEGIVTRNAARALRQGAVAMAISFGMCLVGGLAGGLLYSIGEAVVRGMLGGAEGDIHGAAFFGQMVSRGLAWSVAGLCVGVSQGLAAKSKKVTANGLVGGLVGGLLGGMVFDPVDRLMMGDQWLSPERTRGAEVSRCIGISLVGLLVGFFLGLVENLAKDAWLYMKAGPLRGKQFILYHETTVIGSSPKSHIYIFKDPAVEPRHATLTLHGNRHLVKDLGTPAGMKVNGRAVPSHVLANGDRIQIGDTVLEYGQKIKA